MKGVAHQIWIHEKYIPILLSLWITPQTSTRGFTCRVSAGDVYACRANQTKRLYDFSMFSIKSSIHPSTQILFTTTGLQNLEAEASQARFRLHSGQNVLVLFTSYASLFSIYATPLHRRYHPHFPSVRPFHIYIYLGGPLMRACSVEDGVISERERSLNVDINGVEANTKS